MIIFIDIWGQLVSGLNKWVYVSKKALDFHHIVNNDVKFWLILESILKEFGDLLILEFSELMDWEIGSFLQFDYILSYWLLKWLEFVIEIRLVLKQLNEVLIEKVVILLLRDFSLLKLNVTQFIIIIDWLPYELHESTLALLSLYTLL